MIDDLRKAGYAAVDAKIAAIEKRELVADAQLAEKAFREQARIANDVFMGMYQDALRENKIV